MARKKKNFNWGNFPLKFLKSVLYSEKTSESDRLTLDLNDADQLAPYMASVTTNLSDSYFVKKYREEIEDNFLSEGGHLESVTDYLEKMNYSDIHVGTSEEMMSSLKKKRLTQTLIDAYWREIKSTGLVGDFTFKTRFPNPRSIDLNKSSIVDESDLLHPYQQRAFSKLKKHFIEEDQRAGILQMPTGSGKTRTSVFFFAERNGGARLSNHLAGASFNAYRASRKCILQICSNNKK